MADSWLHLWPDLPNDPKWRTIARVSKQPISTVIAVYLHVLVDASDNVSAPGRLQSFRAEDVASSLDITDEDVAAVLEAMQGRVLDGDRLTFWEKHMGDFDA